MKKIIIALFFLLCSTVVFAQPNVNPPCTYNSNGRAPANTYSPEALRIDSFLTKVGYIPAADQVADNFLKTIQISSNQNSINTNNTYNSITNTNNGYSVFWDVTNNNDVFHNADGTGVFTDPLTQSSIYLDNDSDKSNMLREIRDTLRIIDSMIALTIHASLFSVTCTVATSCPIPAYAYIAYAVSTAGAAQTVTNFTSGLKPYEMALIANQGTGLQFSISPKILLLNPSSHNVTPAFTGTIFYLQ